MNLLNVKVERVDNKQAEQVESVEQHSPEEEENVHGYTESPTKACVDQPHFQQAAISIEYDNGASRES